MRVAMAIELFIMEESMKRSHWCRLKSTSRWFWHWEGETENHFTAKDTWPRGRNAYGAGLGSMQWPKAFKGQRTQLLLSLEHDNDLQALSMCLNLSHAYTERTRAQMTSLAAVISWTYETAHTPISFCLQFLSFFSSVLFLFPFRLLWASYTNDPLYLSPFPLLPITHTALLSAILCQTFISILHTFTPLSSSTRLFPLCSGPIVPEHVKSQPATGAK